MEGGSGKQPGTGEEAKPGCDFRRVQQGAPEGWLQAQRFPKGLNAPVGS